MRKSKLWKKLLDVEHVVIEDGDIGETLDGSEIAVVRLRPDRQRRLRCSLALGMTFQWDGGTF